MIRPATPADIPGILALWNPLIRDTTVTFTPQEKTEAEVAALLAERAAAGQAFLVTEVEGGVSGFAGYGAFRAGAGYARVAEHSILVARAAAGQGLGRALMAAVEAHARGQGVGAMVAGVSGENAEGRAFHAALGYVEVGRLPRVGWKFGRAIDLVLMQKFL